MHRLFRSTLLLAEVLVTVLVTSSVVAAQCPSWSTEFRPSGPNGEVSALLEFDDGAGTALYVGGEFTSIGGVQARNIAKWDGANWSPLGAGAGQHVRALAVFDDGSGPALYAAGDFPYAGGVLVYGVAKWDGSAWSALGGGLNSAAHALEVYDDGSGAALYVGGSFFWAGGVTSPKVAKWNGTSWSSTNYPALTPTVTSLVVFDDGSGPALYAGGNAGTSTVQRWNGVAWTSIGACSAGDYVSDYTVFNRGVGPELVAVGRFTSLGGVAATNAASWNGAQWSPFGSPTSAAGGFSAANRVATYDDGAGAKLLVGGSTAPFLVQWDGANWNTIGGGTNGALSAIETFDAGQGAELWIGGKFSTAGLAGASNLAIWNGTGWRTSDPLGAGIAGTAMSCLASIDLGSGPMLYAGGSFVAAGSVAARSIARWDGASWSALGSGIGSVFGQPTPGSVVSVCAFDAGAGAEIYAGGNFGDAGGVAVSSIARWDGANWSTVGAGPSLSTPQGAPDVYAMVVHDDGTGPALFVGGHFNMAGGASANNIAKWDGAGWSALGVGTNNSVAALAVYDDGAGPALYAFGTFTVAGGSGAQRAAKWDGVSWTALGSGLNDAGISAIVHDDGGGPALFVGGFFTTAGGASAWKIARWNGAAWSSIIPGFGQAALALASYDDGTGPALYVCGDAAYSNHIGRWNGSTWSTVGCGLESIARTLAVHRDGLTPQGSLYVAGSFETLGPQCGNTPSQHIARWSNACACSGVAYCTSGTTSSGCVPVMSGVGSSSATAASGFTITVSNVEGQKQGHIFYGINGPLSSPWGASSHFLCVRGPTQRTPTQIIGGTAGACDGLLTLDWNTYITTHPDALGVPFTAGASIWAQGFFRDPPSAKTTALSNGLQFTVCP